MANDYFRKPLNLIVCEAVRFRLTVLTVRMTQRYGWEVPGGLAQVNLFSPICGWRGHAKSGASPLPTLCQRWHKIKVDCIILCIYYPSGNGVPYQRRRVLENWQSGWSRRFAKPVTLKGVRRFESFIFRCLRAKIKLFFRWVNKMNSFSVYVDSGRWRAAYASVSIDRFRPVFFIWSGEWTNVYHKEIRAS